MLRFTREQFAALGDGTASDRDRQTGQDLQAFYPGHMTTRGVKPDAAADFVRIVRDYAMAYGILAKRETIKLAVIGVTLGAHFPHDPGFEARVSQSLGRPVLPRARRLVLLSDVVGAWLKMTWAGEGLLIIGWRLVERLRRPRPPAEASAGLIPQSPVPLPPAGRAI